MSDVVQIPRVPVRRSFVDPKPAWGRDSGGTLFLRCACGLCMGLDDHTVAADGTVSPSLHHPDDAHGGCGWHVFGRLLDWDGGSAA